MGAAKHQGEKIGGNTGRTCCHDLTQWETPGDAQKFAGGGDFVRTSAREGGKRKRGGKGRRKLKVVYVNGDDDYNAGTNYEQNSRQEARTRGARQDGNTSKMTKEV